MVGDKKASEYYAEYEYNGVVVEKFIDKQQHDYRTVILEVDGKREILLLDFETTGIFEFIKVGDTLIKQKKSLDLRLIRTEMDTIMKMEIYDAPNFLN